MEDVELKKRLNNIQQRISLAANKVGRDLENIKLIAVSKNHSIENITVLKGLGIGVFGENRVQELLDKNEKAADINWHFIGHLQRNKVKYLMRMSNCQLIHSLDSWRLAKEINKRAAKNKRVMPVLLEVNIAEDENKYGFKASEILDLLKKAEKLKSIDIQGLMTIVPYVKNPEEVRPFFRKMSTLLNDINKYGYQLKELSMGMTNDFEIAIEEGATMVRIGTGIFGQRKV